MPKASIIKINTPSFMTNLKEGSSLELKWYLFPQKSLPASTSVLNINQLIKGDDSSLV